MVKYAYKTPTKGNESMNSSKTMAILQKLIKIKYQKKKKRKSKYPSKKFHLFCLF